MSAVTPERRFYLLLAVMLFLGLTLGLLTVSSLSAQPDPVNYRHDHVLPLPHQHVHFDGDRAHGIPGVVLVYHPAPLWTQASFDTPASVRSITPPPPAPPPKSV